jgi:hypothetical protein
MKRSVSQFATLLLCPKAQLQAHAFHTVPTCRFQCRSIETSVALHHARNADQTQE